MEGISAEAKTKDDNDAMTMMMTMMLMMIRLSHKSPIFPKKLAIKMSKSCLKVSSLFSKLPKSCFCFLLVCTLSCFSCV